MTPKKSNSCLRCDMTLGLGREDKGARGNLILIRMPMVKNVLSFFDFDTTISNDGLDF